MWNCDYCKRSHSLTNRVIVEVCGHTKCRQCFLEEADGCMVCRGQERFTDKGQIVEKVCFTNSINSLEEEKTITTLTVTEIGEVVSTLDGDQQNLMTKIGVSTIESSAEKNVSNAIGVKVSPDDINDRLSSSLCGDDEVSKSKQESDSNSIEIPFQFPLEETRDSSISALKYSKNIVNEQSWEMNIPNSKEHLKHTIPLGNTASIKEMKLIAINNDSLDSSKQLESCYSIGENNQDLEAKKSELTLKNRGKERKCKTTAKRKFNDPDLDEKPVKDVKKKKLEENKKRKPLSNNNNNQSTEDDSIRNREQLEDQPLKSSGESIISVSTKGNSSSMTPAEASKCGNDGVQTTPKRKVIRSSKRVMKNADHIQEFTDVDGKRKYHCLACDRKFGSRSQRYYHLDCIQKEVPQHKCNICDKMFVKLAQLKYHLVSHEDESVECNVCKRIFQNRVVMQKHAKLHESKLIPCEFCGRKVRSLEALESHITSVHNKIRPFKCNECNRIYGTRLSLKRHQSSIHGNGGNVGKKFTCEVCGMHLSSNSSLKLHSNIHKRRYTFTCHLCSRTFLNYISFKRHSLFHKRRIKYICKLCNTTTYRRDNMQRHLRSFHESPPVFAEVVKIISTKERRNEGTQEEDQEEFIDFSEKIRIQQNDEGKDTDSKHLNSHRFKRKNTESQQQQQQGGEEEGEEVEEDDDKILDHHHPPSHHPEPMLRTVANSTVIKCVGNVKPLQMQMFLNDIDVNDVIPLPDYSEKDVVANSGDDGGHKKVPNIELYRRILWAESDPPTDDDNESTIKSKCRESLVEKTSLKSDRLDEMIKQQRQQSNSFNDIKVSSNLPNADEDDDDDVPTITTSTIQNKTVSSSPINTKSITNQTFNHPMMHWRKSYKYYYEAESNKSISS